ncbi:MAG: prolipoprotein diacylglyceryl transferase [Thermomicrobiales bacterium]
MPSPSSPVAITIGPLDIRWYAIFILLGMVCGIGLAAWLAKRRDLDPDFLLDMVPWIVIVGLIGARAYYVLLKFHFYMQHPEEAFNVRLGGMTIHGAIVAGVTTTVVYCLRREQPVFRWFDVMVPGLALGQAIGRWGNWANQEAFGTPSTLPWAVRIDPAHRPPRYEQFATFHPTFLYESLFDVANAVVLGWLVLRAPKLRWLRPGDVAWIYLIAYGIARYIIERIRTDSLYIGPLPAAFWFSFALVGAGVLMLIVRRTILTADPAWTEDGDLERRS